MRKRVAGEHRVAVTIDARHMETGSAEQRKRAARHRRAVASAARTFAREEGAAGPVLGVEVNGRGVVAGAIAAERFVFTNRSARDGKLDFVASGIDGPGDLPIQPVGAA